MIAKLLRARKIARFMCTANQETALSGRRIWQQEPRRAEILDRPGSAQSISVVAGAGLEPATVGL
jgi:hypothetical protein